LLKQHDAQFNTDYTWGRHQIGTRFLFNQGTQLFPVNDTQALFNQNLLTRNRKIALTDTWSLRNNLINDVRLQYAYFAQFYANPCGSTCPADVTFGDLGNSTIGPADPQFQKQSTYQVVDNLTWVRGKHTLKFGGQYAHFIYPQFFLSRSLGDYQYANLQEFINDAVPSQAGRTLRGAGTGSFLGTQSLMAGFVQDDIKVSSRLTLNLGVRYEYWTNPVGDDAQVHIAVGARLATGVRAKEINRPQRHDRVHGLQAARQAIALPDQRRRQVVQEQSHGSNVTGRLHWGKRAMPGSEV